jgi:hypothetical protein
MALLRFDGFEGGVSGVASADLVARGWTLPGSNALQSTFNNASLARSGASYLTGQDGNTRELQHAIPVADRTSRNVQGVGVWRSSAVPACAATIDFRDGAGATTVRVQVGQSAIEIYTANGATLQASVLNSAIPGYASLDAWNYVEAQVDHAASGNVTVRVNNAVVLTWSGNTANTGNVTATAVLRAVSAGTTASVRFDDYYFVNGAGSVATFLGDVRAIPLYPSGAGSSTQFTPSTAVANWTTVDEAPYNTTDFNGSATAGHTDLYAMQDLPAGVTSVAGVRVYGVVQKTDAGARTGALLVRTGGTTYEGAEFAPGTTYAYVTHLWPTNPATGVAWTPAEINAIEAGIRVKS